MGVAGGGTGHKGRKDCERLQRRERERRELIFSGESVRVVSVKCHRFCEIRDLEFQNFKVVDVNEEWCGKLLSITPYSLLCSY